MKYHKIKNIPLEICTAEAKIAYNVALINIDDIKAVYDKCTCNLQKADVIREGVKICMNNLLLSSEYEKINKKYNIDLIQCCLNAGLETYINTKYHILSSYAECGKIFKSLYL